LEVGDDPLDLLIGAVLPDHPVDCVDRLQRCGHVSPPWVGAPARAAAPPDDVRQEYIEAVQLETADRHGDAGGEGRATEEQDRKLKEEIVRLNVINAEMMRSEDRQISLTDPDARSMATSGKDTGIVGYNEQIAVDTQHHLIVAHEVTNVGSDRRQLFNMSEQARDALGSETLALEGTALRYPMALVCLDHF
jgi:hypothetical protein